MTTRPEVLFVCGHIRDEIDARMQALIGRLLG
jgi:hypothetical protein